MSASSKRSKKKAARKKAGRGRQKAARNKPSAASRRRAASKAKPAKTASHSRPSAVKQRSARKTSRQSAQEHHAASPATPATAASNKKSHKKPSQAMRKGLDGRTYPPGELLLPGGPSSADEILYLLRGCVAAEHQAGDFGVDEIVSKRSLVEDDPLRRDLATQLHSTEERFHSRIEPLLPPRSSNRRTFASVIERARGRRREIGAFLRGLDLGRTEVSHMDSYGEASLQSLMQWAARLETLGEMEEPEQAEYTHFHRGLDQLDNTTEALIVDVETTLRRLRDKSK